MVVVLLIGLYTSRVILRTLGFDDYGIYNVVGSVVIFFSFLNTALTNATSRYLTFELGADNRDKLNKTYSMSIILHIGLAFVLFLLLEIGGGWFVNNKLNIAADRVYATNWCFQFSLLTFCTHVIRVPFSSSIIAHEEMNFYAVISIIEKILQLGIVFLVAWSSYDKLIFYSALLFVVSVIVLIAFNVYCKLKFKDCSFKFFWDNRMVKEFASYSGYSMLVNCADIVSVQSRNVFFNWFVGTLANAALGVANQVTNLMVVFVDNFSKAIQPQIIKSYASNDRSYFMTILYSSSKLNFYLFLFISVPIVLNVDFILDLWLGEYPAQTPSFVKAIVVYMIIDALQQPLWMAVHATGNLRIHQIMMSFIKILTVPCTYILLVRGYSPMAALYLWAGLNGVCAITRTIYMRYLIDLSLSTYMKKVLVKIVAVSMLTIPLPYYLSLKITNEWGKLIATTSVMCVLLPMFVMLVGLTTKERKFLLNLVYDKIGKVFTSFLNDKEIKDNGNNQF